MIGDGLLESILPEIAGTAVLASLLQLDLPEAADPVLRLGALLEPGAEQARRVARRLRLSKAETAELVMLGEPEAVLGDAAAVLTLGRDDPTVRHALSIALYRHGRQAFRTALAIGCARLLSGEDRKSTRLNSSH